MKKVKKSNSDTFIRITNTDIYNKIEEVEKSLITMNNNTILIKEHSINNRKLIAALWAFVIVLMGFIIKLI